MPKKIVVIGPESTGKSTLTEALASHFREPWVPEYAREYLEKLDRPYEFNDLLNIAKGQVALEESQLKLANKYLFCDTDLHVLQVWSESKYKEVHPWILAQIEVRRYDLYILTDIDTTWEPDPLREHPEPEMRQFFFDWYRNLLEKSGTSFQVVRGDKENRISQALRFINQIL
ncbi:AAA family ATPase [Lunatibacter salilacus]|uniref:AAA family ATPase n=1 Tax=Lunatibacter salilacus TaxID=2483804 RepID=UPI00131B237E|nr:ATP-binding protein [Lunatibacter salilacus]